MHPPTSSTITPSGGRHVHTPAVVEKTTALCPTETVSCTTGLLPLHILLLQSLFCCCCNSNTSSITMVHPPGNHIDIGCHHPQHHLLHQAHPSASFAVAAHSPQHKEKGRPTPPGFNCQRTDKPTNSKSSITSSTTATATAIERRCLYCRRRVFKSERGRTLHHRRCRRIYVDRWKKVKVVCDIKLRYVSLFY